MQMLRALQIMPNRDQNDKNWGMLQENPERLRNAAHVVGVRRAHDLLANPAALRRLRCAARLPALPHRGAGRHLSYLLEELRLRKGKGLLSASLPAQFSCDLPKISSLT